MYHSLMTFQFSEKSWNVHLWRRKVWTVWLLDYQIARASTEVTSQCTKTHQKTFKSCLHMISKASPTGNPRATDFCQNTYLIHFPITTFLWAINSNWVQDLITLKTFGFTPWLIISKNSQKKVNLFYVL